MIFYVNIIDNYIWLLIYANIFLQRKYVDN